MKRTLTNRALLAGLVVVAAAGWTGVSRTVLHAQTAQTKIRNLPIFEVDRAWPKLPPKWKLGDPSSFAVDAKDNVWLLHRPRTLKPDEAAMAAPPVMVFDAAGNFVNAWGGAGAGYEWPEREHAIHIDPKGFVWVSGNNCPTNGLAGLKPVADDQVLKFTPDGKFVMQIGRSNQSKGNADTRNLHRAADMSVYARTNELFVADGYGNHRVAVFDADTGAFKRMWGAFANKPVDDDHCDVVTPKSFPDGPGPQNFSIVHAIRVAKDGMVYVADRENRRVQMFTSEGKFVKQLVKTATPFARNLALSSDPQQQFLYVGNGDDIVIVDRKTLEAVGSIKVAGMIGGGHQIATDSKGNIYIAQTAAGMQKLAFIGMAPDARKAWTPPRTPWGDPDLQGNYTNKYEHNTPLERPREFEGRRVEDVTGAELAGVLEKREQQVLSRAAGVGPFEFRDPLEVTKASRAWLIVDPLDGKMPPLTPEARRRLTASDAFLDTGREGIVNGRQGTRGSWGAGPFNTPEDFGLWDRCITRGIPGSMMPHILGNSYQIVQAPGLVTIRYELIHDTRVIPLDGRPHVGKGIRLDMGDARGRWEGSTLVVETTNFHDRSVYRNANAATLRLVERFTPTAPDRMEWAVTVDDATTWTRPWTFAMPLTMTDREPVLEFACHEGNYALPNILSAARAAEHDRADVARKP